MPFPFLSNSPLPHDSRGENNIAFLRLLLAVMVIWSHSFQLLGAFDPLAHALGGGAGVPWITIVNLGRLAVNGFFVLSGFLIAGSWARRRHWPSFLSARVRRICPAWFVCIAICAFVVAPLGSTDAGATWRQAVAHPERLRAALLMLVPWFPPTFQDTLAPNNVNASLWTLPYEFRLYVLVPLFGTLWLLLCRGLRRRKVWWLPALVFAGIYALYFAQLAGWWTQAPGVLTVPDKRLWLLVDASRWPRLATYFAAGVVLYVYRERLRAVPRFTVFCLAVLLVALWSGTLPWALPIFGSYALMSLALDARWPLPRIPANFDVSYGTYLYAWPIQQLLIHFLGAQINPYALFALSSIGALAAGTLSWLLVERPFLKSRRAVDFRKS